MGWHWQVMDDRGRFITFEGIDGAGKTTQIQRVRAWILAHPSWRSRRALVVTREPGGTALGQQLRRLLLAEPPETGPAGEAERLDEGAELMLYAADRAQHVATVLLPTLMQGGVVLCDRYVDSTIAYQGYGRQLNLKRIEVLNDLATGGLRPDLTLWLDVPVDAGAARRQRRAAGGDRLEGETRAFHERVRSGFAALAQRDCDRVVRVDGTGDEATVFGQVQGILRDRFRQWYGVELD